jgi:hypothetical protein
MEMLDPTTLLPCINTHNIQIICKVSTEYYYRLFLNFCPLISLFFHSTRRATIYTDKGTGLEVNSVNSNAKEKRA